MGKQAIGVAMAIIMVAALALVGCGGGQDTPEATVEAFFAALAKGDTEAANKMLSAKAEKTMPQKGTPEYEMVAVMGKAFQKVDSVKIEGDKAQVVVQMDGNAVAEKIMDMRKDMIEKIDDPEAKKKAEEQMAQAKAHMAATLAKMPLVLIKEGGRWVLAEPK